MSSFSQVSQAVHHRFLFLAPMHAEHRLATRSFFPDCLCIIGEELSMPCNNTTTTEPNGLCTSFSPAKTPHVSSDNRSTPVKRSVRIRHRIQPLAHRGRHGPLDPASRLLLLRRRGIRLLHIRRVRLLVRGVADGHADADLNSQGHKVSDIPAPSERELEGRQGNSPTSPAPPGYCSQDRHRTSSHPARRATTT